MGGGTSIRSQPANFTRESNPTSRLVKILLKHHIQYIRAVYKGQERNNTHTRATLTQTLRANKLTLNMTKTEFMLIGSRQRLSTLTESPTFAINDFQVSQVTTAKSLGVTIDDRLDIRLPLPR